MADWHNSAEWQKARTYAKTVLENRCALCSKELVGGDWTIDHISPPSVTGKPDHNISNLQSMCRECNGRKQDKVLVRASWRSERW